MSSKNNENGTGKNSAFVATFSNEHVLVVPEIQIPGFEPKTV